MNKNNKIIVTDPKDTPLLEFSEMLKDNGYEIKIFEIDFNDTKTWNPFNHINEDDIEQIITSHNFIGLDFIKILIIYK